MDNIEQDLVLKKVELESSGGNIALITQRSEVQSLPMENTLVPTTWIGNFPVSQWFPSNIWGKVQNLKKYYHWHIGSYFVWVAEELELVVLQVQQADQGFLPEPPTVSVVFLPTPSGFCRFSLPRDGNTLPAIF
jgi:hypothetical protein